MESIVFPKLCDLFDVFGVTVAIDVMGCQRDVVEKVVGCGVVYCLVLRGNQKSLCEEVEVCFESFYSE